MLKHHLVDEQLGQARHNQTGHHQQQTEQPNQQGRHPGGSHLVQQLPHGPRPNPTTDEIRPWLEGQHHAGEALIELGGGDHATTGGWVGQVYLAAANAFQHEEMVEVPVNDGRHNDVAELRRLLAEALGLQPV